MRKLLRGRMGVAIVAFVAAMAGTAVANHQFGDVATSNTFHDAIDNFANAGCGTGFPGGLFKPDDPVKRQQMARFVNACGGRAAFDDGVVATVTGTNQDLAEASISAGALVGGGFVTATATSQSQAGSATVSDFPCEIEYRLFTSAGDVSRSMIADLDDPEVGGADVDASLVEHYVVEAGQDLTVTLRVKKEASPPCAANVLALGEVLLQYFPFDGNGDGGGESLPE
jgi:hypothetical protein